MQYFQPLSVTVASIVLLIGSSAWMYHSNYYLRHEEGGPAGPEFYCLTWDKPLSYSTFSYEAGCVMATVPWLVSYAIPLQTNPATQAVGLVFAEAVLLAGPFLAWRIRRQGKQPVTKHTPERAVT